MKKIAILTIGLLAGCSNELAQQKEDSQIVLACTGTSHLVAPERTEETSYLIRFDPAGGWQTSLHFFSSQKQRFLSPCTSAFNRCSAHASPDLITETGILVADDGQALMSKETTINRRTGFMAVVVTDRVLGPSVQFEGSCQKGTLPEETAAKF